MSLILVALAFSVLSFQDADIVHIKGSPDNLVIAEDGTKVYVDPTTGHRMTFRRFEQVVFYSNVVPSNQKLPLFSDGETSDGKTAPVSGVNFTCEPSDAGTFDTQFVSAGENPPDAYFVPAETFSGIVTITAKGVNSRGDEVTGEIVIDVIAPVATSIVVTAGSPVDK